MKYIIDKLIMFIIFITLYDIIKTQGQEEKNINIKVEPSKYNKLTIDDLDQVKMEILHDMNQHIRTIESEMLENARLNEKTLNPWTQNGAPVFIPRNPYSNLMEIPSMDARAYTGTKADDSIDIQKYSRFKSLEDSIEVDNINHYQNEIIQANSAISQLKELLNNNENKKIGIDSLGKIEQKLENNLIDTQSFLEKSKNNENKPNQNVNSNYNNIDDKIDKIYDIIKNVYDMNKSLKEYNEKLIIKNEKLLNINNILTKKTENELKSDSGLNQNIKELSEFNNNNNTNNSEIKTDDKHIDLKSNDSLISDNIYNNFKNEDINRPINDTNNDVVNQIPDLIMHNKIEISDNTKNENIKSENDNKKEKTDNELKKLNLIPLEFSDINKNNKNTENEDKELPPQLLHSTTTLDQLKNIKMIQISNNDPFSNNKPNEYNQKEISTNEFTNQHNDYKIIHENVDNKNDNKIYKKKEVLSINNQLTDNIKENNINNNILNEQNKNNIISKNDNILNENLNMNILPNGPLNLNYNENKETEIKQIKQDSSINNSNYKKELNDNNFNKLNDINKKLPNGPVKFLSYSNPMNNIHTSDYWN